ncbi:MAG: hypothetical protein AB8H80_18595 [Planctomycetota bacterium]
MISVPTAVLSLLLLPTPSGDAARPVADSSRASLLTSCERLDPPARVLHHLERAREAAKAGDVELALEHIAHGLAEKRSEGRSVAYDQARLQLWAIDWRKREVQRRVDAGELLAARDLLERASELLSDPFAKSRGKELAKLIDKAEKSARSSKTQQRAAARINGRIKRRIVSAENYFASAQRELDRAVATSHRTVHSARRAQTAQRRFDIIDRSVARWLKVEGLSSHTKAQLLALGSRSREGAIAAMLRIANARTLQGDFREALQWVASVEQRDRRNPDAKELRRTIQLSAAASGGWIGFGPGIPAAPLTGRR